MKCKMWNVFASLFLSFLLVLSTAFGAMAKENETVTIPLLLFLEDGKQISEDITLGMEYPGGKSVRLVAEKGMLVDTKFYTRGFHTISIEESDVYEMEPVRLQIHEGNLVGEVIEDGTVSSLEVKRKSGTGSRKVVADPIFVNMQTDSGKQSVTKSLNFRFKDLETGKVTEKNSEEGIIDGLLLIPRHRYEVSLQENPDYTMEKLSAYVTEDKTRAYLTDENLQQITEFIVIKSKVEPDDRLARIKEELSKKVSEAEQYISKREFEDKNALEDARQILEKTKTLLKKADVTYEELEPLSGKIDEAMNRLKLSEKMIKQQDQEDPKKDRPNDKGMEQPDANMPKKEEPKSNPDADMPKKEEPKANPDVNTPKKEEPKSNPDANMPKKEAPKSDSKQEMQKKEQQKESKPKSSEDRGKNAGRSNSGRSNSSRSNSSGKGRGSSRVVKVGKQGKTADVKRGKWIRDAIGWWYRFHDGTYPKSAWLQDDGKWYYFDDRGYMATGWVEHGGKWYYLTSNGSMLVNAVTPDGFKVDANGVWMR